MVRVALAPVTDATCWSRLPGRAADLFERDCKEAPEVSKDRLGALHAKIGDLDLRQLPALACVNHTETDQQVQTVA